MSTPSTGFSLPYQAIGQLVNLHHQAKEANYSLPHQSWAGPIQRITICAYRQFWQLTQSLRHNVQKMIVSFFLTKSRKYHMLRLARWLTPAAYRLLQVQTLYVLHDFGHRSVTHNVTIDYFFQHVYTNLALGYCTEFTQIYHNLHHTFPHKVRHSHTKVCQHTYTRYICNSAS